MFLYRLYYQKSTNRYTGTVESLQNYVHCPGCNSNKYSYVHCTVVVDRIMSTVQGTNPINTHRYRSELIELCPYPGYYSSCMWKAVFTPPEQGPTVEGGGGRRSVGSGEGDWQIYLQRANIGLCRERAGHSQLINNKSGNSHRLYTQYSVALYCTVQLFINIVLYSCRVHYICIYIKNKKLYDSHCTQQY